MFSTETTKGLADICQPLFIRVARIAALVLFICDVIYTAIKLVNRIVAGTLFSALVEMEFLNSKFYWAVLGVWSSVGHLLFSGFTLMCLLAALVWVYQKIMRLAPVPAHRPDITIKKLHPAYIALGAYSVGWLVLGGIASVALINILRVIADDSAEEMVRGITILISPVVIVMFVAVLVFAVFLSALPIPCAMLFRQMLDFIMRPCAPAEQKGVVSDEE